MKLYIAGGSADLVRVKRMAAEAEKQSWVLVEKWWETVERVGAANPANATKAQRKEWAQSCLRGVDAADYVWVLVPPPGAPSIGCWVEFGYACAKGKLAALSGNNTNSIFGALAGLEVETDEKALELMDAVYKAATGGVRGA